MKNLNNNIFILKDNILYIKSKNIYNDYLDIEKNNQDIFFDYNIDLNLRIYYINNKRYIYNSQNQEYSIFIEDEEYEDEE